MLARRSQFVGLLATFVVLGNCGIISESQLRSSYDYIVIGGGTAGLVVANRLSEDPRVSVLVVEAGPLDKGENFIHIPRFVGTAGDGLTSVYNWNFPAEPQPELNGRAINPPAGRCVGGSSAINALLFDRGSINDYNSWEELGNPGWGWKSLLPYFIKIETYNHPPKEIAQPFNITFDPSAHGYSGPVQSSYGRGFTNQTDVIFDAFKDLGVPREVDGTNGRKVNALWGSFSLHPTNRSRSYARPAYFEPVLKRRNYDALLETRVTRILTSSSKGGRKSKANGIEIAKSSTSARRTIKANREVILSAGAVASPKILQLSGIGPKKVLQSLNIPVVEDLPGVGYNYQDHSATPVVQPFAEDPQAVNDTIGEYLYYKNRTGPWSGSGLALGFLPLSTISNRSSDILARYAFQSNSHLPADLHPTLLAGYERQKQLLIKYLPTDLTAASEYIYGGGAVVATILHPFSRGYTIINSTDPFANQIINQRYLSNPIDYDVLVDQVRYARRILATPSIQALGPLGPEVLPGEGVEGEEELREFVRGILSTFSHVSGTCSMMPRQLGGVVDKNLRVYGVDGLRVVDASVIPLVPGTHLQATVYAIAEKASDIIKRGD
ncbi:GMC oxidoreductase [Ascobolus immersus RN42]|uniref:GMC oxidoreductase n=1 Tax=Ascobolus immersus RN42 TaxID=1160509 RepID=A0A3N4IHW2_ASCIM|nr:GMC oxidoreductase [Ascobolus immersus RN42]